MASPFGSKVARIYRDSSPIAANHVARVGQAYKSATTLARGGVHRTRHESACSAGRQAIRFGRPDLGGSYLDFLKIGSGSPKANAIPLAATAS